MLGEAAKWVRALIEPGRLEAETDADRPVDEGLYSISAWFKKSHFLDQSVSLDAEFCEEKDTRGMRDR